jgi:hypothetical protein
MSNVNTYTNEQLSSFNLTELKAIAIQMNKILPKQEKIRNVRKYKMADTITLKNLIFEKQLKLQLQPQPPVSQQPQPPVSQENLAQYHVRELILILDNIDENARQEILQPLSFYFEFPEPQPEPQPEPKKNPEPQPQQKK